MVVEPYEWTLEVLAELRARSIPVVVLSNAWPSLRRLHRRARPRPLREGDGHLGRGGRRQAGRADLPPALDLLGQPPGRVLFVDDWPGHVEAANRLGMRGIWLRHGDRDAADGLEQIADLRALLDVVG